MRAIAIGVLVLALAAITCPQNSDPDNRGRGWDFGVWAAGQTGEENTNSITEAQILSAGFSSAGRDRQDGQRLAPRKN
jgi:hypothetical protein